MAENQTNLSPAEIEARSAIGRRVVYWAIGAVTLLGFVAMVVGGLGTKGFGPV
jgi:hypothetical protein